MLMPERVTRVVLITGGSQGIGAATVQRFRDKGWNVSTIALPGENLKRWRSGSVLTVEGDVTSKEVRTAVVERTLQRFGRIDALVNNAGIGLYGSPAKLPAELLGRLFDVNAVAPLGFAQLVIPAMRRQGGGTIVNIGSVAGNVSMPWAVGYCASKFALHALNDSLRLELRRDRIRVVKVCPGMVATRFRDNVIWGSVPRKLADLRPVISPEKVAKAIYRAVDSAWLNTVYVPELGRIFSAVQRFCPPLMDWYLQRVGAESLPEDDSTRDQNTPVAVESGAAL
jgi:NAD(P)-dependent dehydrogenase (short-subunit alcohol dehydrogenase family)